MYLMPSTLISNGALLLYQQRRKSKFIKNKIPKGALLLFHSVISPLALPVFFGEGARSGWGSNHDRMVNGKIQDYHQEVKVKSFRSEIHDLLGTVKPVLG